MVAEVVASSSSALTLDVKIYTHRDRITTDPEGGVEEHHISVILALSVRKTGWTIQCMDLGELDGALLKAGRGAIFEAIFRVLDNHAIEPRLVRGWTRWGVNPHTIALALNSYNRTGQVEQMPDYMPRSRKNSQECGAKCST